MISSISKIFKTFEIFHQIYIVMLATMSFLVYITPSLILQDSII